MNGRAWFVSGVIVSVSDNVLAVAENNVKEDVPCKVRMVWRGKGKQ
jgi:hypothetical protein